MKIFSKLFVVLFCALAVAPIAWHLSSSFKSADEITRIPPTIIPGDATLSNYLGLFERRPFLAYCFNSFVIASLSSILCVAAASLAAYPLARARAQARSVAASALLALAFFPTIVFLTPLYELVRSAGLINHPWGLIIPYAALNLPMAIWLLTGYFQQIPVELEEAAAIDGLSPLQTLTRIIAPLAGPALAAVVVLAFIFSWNEFMLALTFMNAEPAKTVTVAVATLSGAFVYDIPWGLISAGVIVSSIPLIVLVLFFQRRIVAGLTAGSVK